MMLYIVIKGLPLFNKYLAHCKGKLMWSHAVYLNSSCIVNILLASFVCGKVYTSSDHTTLPTPSIFFTSSINPNTCSVFLYRKKPIISELPACSETACRLFIFVTLVAVCFM